MPTATAKKPRAKQKPLTPREKRLLAILSDPPKDIKTYQDALIGAGYSEATANSSASRTIQQVAGKSGMVDALEKQGIDMDFIAGKHKEGLEANKVISAIVIHKSGKNKEADSQTNDFIEVPDHPVRHKHLDTIHKIRGDFTEKVEHSLDSELEGRLTAALKRELKGDDK